MSRQPGNQDYYLRNRYGAAGQTSAAPAASSYTNQTSYYSSRNAGNSGNTYRWNGGNNNNGGAGDFVGSDIDSDADAKSADLSSSGSSASRSSSSLSVDHYVSHAARAQPGIAPVPTSTAPATSPALAPANTGALGSAMGSAASAVSPRLGSDLSHSYGSFNGGSPYMPASTPAPQQSSPSRGYRTGLVQGGERRRKTMTMSEFQQERPVDDPQSSVLANNRQSLLRKQSQPDLIISELRSSPSRTQPPTPRAYHSFQQQQQQQQPQRSYTLQQPSLKQKLQPLPPIPQHSTYGGSRTNLQKAMETPSPSEAASMAGDNRRRRHKLGFLRLGKRKDDPKYQGQALTTTSSGSSSTLSGPPVRSRSSSITAANVATGSPPQRFASLAPEPRSQYSSRTKAPGASTYGGGSVLTDGSDSLRTTTTSNYSYGSGSRPMMGKTGTMQSPHTRTSSFDRRSMMTSAEPPAQQKSTGSKFMKFTKGAMHLMRDAAFGNSVLEPDREARANKVRLIRRREQLAQQRQQRLAEMGEPIQKAGEQQYLENLQFFLKYMDDSEPNDPINYASSRRDMWLLWYTKFLTALRHKIELYEAQSVLKQHVLALQHPRGSSRPLNKKMAGTVNRSRSSTTSSSSTNSSSLGSSSISPSSLTSTSMPSMNSGGGGTANSAVDTSTTAAKVEKLKKKLFQDRRVVLCLLWYLQIFQKLMHQRETVLRLSRKNTSAFVRTKPSEICFVTTNKMSSTRSRLGHIGKSLLGNSIASSNIEFVSGWYMRHSSEGSHVNTVTVADVLKTLTDVKGRGCLEETLQEENADFKDPRLDKRFLIFELGGREKRFMEDYSSFITSSSTIVPLADQSQDTLVAEDLTSCITDELSLARTLDEFRRVIKPKGSLYLQMWDIDPCAEISVKQKETRIRSTREYLRYRIWQKLAEYSEYSGVALPDITRHIMPALEKCGFRNIRTSYIAYPLVSSLGDEDDSDSDDDHLDGGDSDDGDVAERVSSEDATLAGGTPARPSAKRGSDAGNRASTETDPATVNEVKDSRANSFFEAMSSFTEFTKAVKVLGLHSLDNDLSVCEDLETLHKRAISGTTAENKEQSKQFARRLTHLKDIDEERLHLAKLFIDYKLNNVDGDLVRSEILGPGSFGNSLPEKSLVDDETIYEGLGYVMVVTADRI